MVDIDKSEWHTNNNEITEWLSAVFVNYWPEMYCNGARSDRWTEALNNQIRET